MCSLLSLFGHKLLSSHITFFFLLTVLLYTINPLKAFFFLLYFFNKRKSRHWSIIRLCFVWNYSYVVVHEKIKLLQNKRNISGGKMKWTNLTFSWLSGLFTRKQISRSCLLHDMGWESFVKVSFVSEVCISAGHLFSLMQVLR